MAYEVARSDPRGGDLAAYARIVAMFADFEAARGSWTIYLYRSEAARLSGRLNIDQETFEVPSEPVEATYSEDDPPELLQPGKASFTQFVMANLANYIAARVAIYQHAVASKKACQIHVLNSQRTPAPMTDIGDLVTDATTGEILGFGVTLSDPEEDQEIVGFARVASLSAEFVGMFMVVKCLVWDSLASYQAKRKPIPGVEVTINFPQTGTPAVLDADTGDVIEPAIPSFTEFISTESNGPVYNDLRTAGYNYCRPLMAAISRFDGVVDLVDGGAGSEG